MKNIFESSVNSLLLLMFVLVLLQMVIADCRGCISTNDNPPNRQETIKRDKMDMVDSLNR